jgi:hypothetical protein
MPQAVVSAKYAESIPYLSGTVMQSSEKLQHGPEAT